MATLPCNVELSLCAGGHALRDAGALICHPACLADPLAVAAQALSLHVCETELGLSADDEALPLETIQQSSATLPAWLAYSSNGAGVAWAADKDMGALLHGFMLRFGGLFDCARQTVDIGKVLSSPP